MRADRKQVATFLFQFNCLPNGLQGPAATAKLIAPKRPTPPKATSRGGVIDKDDAAPRGESDPVTPKRRR